MDNDWRKCINIDKHLHMMTIKAKVAHFISNTLLSMTASVGVTYLLGEYVMHSVFLTEDHNDTLRQLPIKVQFPFETQQSPTFEILLAVIFVNVMMNVCVVALINGLIFSLVIYIYIFVFYVTDHNLQFKIVNAVTLKFFFTL